jgi:hypothetical protein
MAEAADPAALLGESDSHWLMAELESRGKVVLLETLSPSGGRLPLPADAVLVLAQPRPLSPQENVALDDWVRQGGKVLLFADPRLTAHTIYPLGDARRPQDVAMLSPILARWGLGLGFDDAQVGQRLIPLPGGGGGLPVDLPGVFVVIAGESAGRCVTLAASVVARCEVGKGKVVAVADAAVLDADLGEIPDDRQRRAFAWLMRFLTEA